MTSYTTDSLIAGVQRRAAIPLAQQTFQSADILTLADQEIRSNLLPTIMSTRETYYSFNFDQALNSTGVYSIPTRAVGAKLDCLYLLGNNNLLYKVDRVEEDDVWNTLYSPNGNPAFYFKANTVTLLPATIDNVTTVRMAVFIRPNALCATTSAAQITAINGNTVTCSNVPAAITTSTTTDLIKGSPHYDFWAIDQTPTAVTPGTNGTITYASLPTGIQVGDWIALSEQSPVVQIPTEWQPILEQRVANACLRIQGLTGPLELGVAALKEMESSIQLLTPRAEREPKRARPRNGLLRRGPFWFA